MTVSTNYEILMEQAQNLIKKKDGIEAQIKTQLDLLSSHGVGMNDPLVDKDGFPRAELDIYTIRSARHQVVCLQNDLKQAMDDIAVALNMVHEQARREGRTTPGSSRPETNSTNPSLSPFAKVNGVSPDSPAWTCGLQREDLILDFGGVIATGANPLQEVAALVGKSENNAITVVVKRGELQHTLQLTPQKWSGRGLLGCHLVPL